MMGIVHGAVSYLPELVQYLATVHPDLVVKAGESQPPVSEDSRSRLALLLRSLTEV